MNQQLRAELENKNKTSELALLRTQLNPHFLFNTLNNIDSLILTNPNKASDAIIKLSDIMRFMLYDTSTDQVSLEKEINYLESYISLQQIRLKDPSFVRFTKEFNKDKTPGIGLANTKRRLELLYPGRHHYRVRLENGLYIASLIITH